MLQSSCCASAEPRVPRLLRLQQISSFLFFQPPDSQKQEQRTDRKDDFSSGYHEGRGNVTEGKLILRDVELIFLECFRIAHEGGGIVHRLERKLTCRLELL